MGSSPSKSQTQAQSPTQTQTQTQKDTACNPTTLCSDKFASILETYRDRLTDEQTPVPQLLQLLETIDNATRGIMNNTDNAMRMYHRMFNEPSLREETDSLDRLKKNLTALRDDLKHFNTIERAQTDPSKLQLQTGGGGSTKLVTTPSTVFLFGRHRRVYRRGRAQCIKYKGAILPLTEARQLAKRLKK